jgi:uncharacterized protein (DUF2336 family)
MTVERTIPAAVIAEFVVEHAVLSGNRFDSRTVVVSGLGEPSAQDLSRQARERRAEQFDDVVADDLTARETRRRVQTAERVLTCTSCNHTHREER